MADQYQNFSFTIEYCLYKLAKNFDTYLEKYSKRTSDFNLKDEEPE